MALTGPGVNHPGNGEPPAAEPSGPRRRSLWRWCLAGLGSLLAAAVVVLAVLAATYQPALSDGAWGGSFPGMPTGTGIRPVNTFGIPAGAGAGRVGHRSVAAHPSRRGALDVRMA
jgi:hypothetical protein